MKSVGQLFFTVLIGTFSLVSFGELHAYTKKAPNAHPSSKHSQRHAHHYSNNAKSLRTNQDNQAQVTSNKLDELVSTADGIILLFGWDYENAQRSNFDSSKLTHADRQSFMQRGVDIIKKKAEDNQELEYQNQKMPVWESILSKYYHDRDKKKCLYWAFKGIDKGCAECMCLLSCAYISGDGVVQDFVEGMKWRYLAASRGNEFSKTWIEENGIKFTFDKDFSPILEEGRKRANKWMDEHRTLFIAKY